MKVTFAAGIWDMLHHGHIELLKRMRQQSDLVVVIVHDDKSCYEIKGKIPVQDLEHRIKNIMITGLADSILITRETDPAKEFKKVIFQYGKENLIYMRGDDLTEDFLGRWMLDRYEIPIDFKPYTKGVSSSKLRDEL